MCMTHICKSNKYRSMICRISQKPRNDRTIKTVKFLFLLSIFIDDGVDLYSTRCMFDPNFMALALTGTEKQSYMQNLIKSCQVSKM